MLTVHRLLHAIVVLALLTVSARALAQPARFDPVGMGGGGALFEPSFSPHHANELFLSCDMGELFHSTDLAGRWDVVDFRQIAGGNHRARAVHQQPCGALQRARQIQNRRHHPDEKPRQRRHMASPGI